MAPRKRRVDPQRQALRSTDEELDAASVITPEDLALLAETAPEPIRKYLNAEPDPDDDATT